MFDLLGVNRKFHEFLQDPIDKDGNFFISPVEAELIADGKIEKNGEIISKAGRKINLAEVLGESAEYFSGGFYLNFYLSPQSRHYWRIPYDCKMISTKINNGRSFFPVFIGLDKFFGSNIFFEKAIRKNASIGQIFETKSFRFAMMPVGSLNVNRIHIVDERNGEYNKGDIGGYFSAGSSVLLCFPNYPLEVLVQVGAKVKIGDGIVGIKNE